MRRAIMCGLEFLALINWVNIYINEVDLSIINYFHNTRIYK
jgi:hypothetical protein